MLLKQNASRINYSCELDLYFDDSTHKTLTLLTGMYVSIKYRHDGEIDIVSGVVSEILPTTIKNGQYGCCACGETNNISTGMIILDYSEECECKKANIMIKDILDFEFISDKYSDASPMTLNQVIKESAPYSIIRLSAGEYKDDIVIDKPITLVGKIGSTYISGRVLATADVTMKSIIFTLNKSYEDNKAINIKCNGIVNIEGCTFIASVYCRNPIFINASKIAISRNSFISMNEDAVYNWIEIGLDQNYPIKESNIHRNTFTGQIKHNHISMYTFEELSMNYIRQNRFEYSCNAIRISNTTSSAFSLFISENNYQNTDDTNSYEYAGLFFLQDYSKEGEKMDFNKVIIHIFDNIGPDGYIIKENIPNTINQLYYVYDDQDGIITSKNQPTIIIRNN